MVQLETQRLGCVMCLARDQCPGVDCDGVMNSYKSKE